MKFLLVFALLSSFSVLAESPIPCPQNVQKVTTGTPAPCPGWHVSDRTMQNIARTDEELEKHKKLVQSMEHLRKLDLDEIEHYKKHSREAHEALSLSERQKLWVGIGAFALGVVLTGVAAKAAIESTR